MPLFDTRTVLAEIENQGATSASFASSASLIPKTSFQEAEEAAGYAQNRENVDMLQNALNAAEERAAMPEFDAGITREMAERRALHLHDDSIVQATAGGSIPTERHNDR